MNPFTRGLVAGLSATLVLSALMLIKAALGIMPQLNIIAMLSWQANDLLGTPTGPAVGWVAHFLIGTVLYGLVFTSINRVLPSSSYWIKGIYLAIIGWLLMMLFLMPMAGQALFGLRLGFAAPVMTLILHLIFGAVLGASYAKLKVSFPDPAEQ